MSKNLVAPVLSCWLIFGGAAAAQQWWWYCDPAGAYYEDYYAVYFVDPDGIKLELLHRPGAL